MKITILAMEIPYPAIHGGRVDIWRRIQTISNLGTDIQLLCWCPEVPNSEDLAIIKKYVRDFYPIFYDRTFQACVQRTVNLFMYPLEVTSRIVTKNKFEHIVQSVRDFQPDVILSDHIHCGVVAVPLSQELNIPMVVRSHNIEHLHYRYLLKSAKGYQKFLRLLSLNHLECYEKSVLKQSLAFYDISVDDLRFWEKQGLKNGFFLPPLIDFNEQNSPETFNGSIDYDIVFLGNLRTENNTAGIFWFIEDVLPLLKTHVPEIKVLIAGSSPTSRIKKIIQETEGVHLKVNPVSVMDVYQSGRVLVNPIAMGSGVSIKSIDMLTAGKPIVTLPKGLYGLPEEAKQFFCVATDAQSFAMEVLHSLKDTTSKVPDRELLNSLFGYSVIEEFLSNLSMQIQDRSLASH